MHVRLRHITAVACAAWALSALPAHAACTYPKDPGAMPDGRTATLDQMKAAQASVKAYNTAMDEYLKCIDAESPKASDITADMTPDQKKQLQKEIEASVKKHNAAVSDEEAVAARFNDQLKAYKAKQPN
jgi:hypothetical protein